MRTYGISKVKIREKNMVRDMSNKALLNTDLEGLRAYKDRKKSMEKVNLAIEEIQDMKDEINIIKGDLSIIKELLLKVFHDDK